MDQEELMRLLCDLLPAFLLRTDEADRAEAYELGRDALCHHITPLDVSNAVCAAVVAISGDYPRHCQRLLDVVRDFHHEVLAPYALAA